MSPRGLSAIVCRVQILLIEPTKYACERVFDEFNKVKSTLERNNGFHMEFVKAVGIHAGIEYLQKGKIPHSNKVLKGEYGDIQAVVLNWNVAEASESLAEISRIRSDIHIFVVTTQDDAYNRYSPEFRRIHFIQRSELELGYSLVLQRIVNTINERRRTPFWTAYKEYVEEANYTWHTPGHAGGASFKNSPYLYPFYEFFGEHVFTGDLSVSVEELGSLLDSTGYVGLTEAKAARTFNVRKTFFVTNGSSNSNKIILQTVLRPGDKAIIDRNCHKSIHYGMVQAQATPVYLNSDYSCKYGILAPPSLKEIEDTLWANPDAKMLILTGCTYDGLLLPMKKIVDLVKRINREKGLKIKLFIDEAWFGYGSFHPDFKEYSAIIAGADYITHSAHKVLSAFSQSSFIHVNDPDFDEDYFREIFHLYTSTSPQYQIIASLGVCSMQMEMEGFKLISKALEQANRFKEAVKKHLKDIRVVEMKDFGREFKYVKQSVGYGHDPLKVLLDVSALDIEVSTIQDFLRDKGFEVEKSTQEGTILFLFTIGTSASKEGELFFALSEIEADSLRFDRKIRPSSKDAGPMMKLPPIETKGLAYFYKPREAVRLERCEGRISAFFVTPYPPGIPVLVPGQTIRTEHIVYLETQMKAGRTIHGCDQGLIFVHKA